METTAGIISLLKKNKGGLKKAYQVAWPAILESFFIAFAGLVDSLMVSSLGPYAVAAVGLTTNPKIIGLCFFMALGVAVSALTARRKGEGRRKEANEILIMGLVVTIIVGIVISIICVIFAPCFMLLARAGEDTLEPSVLYFRIIMGGMMFNVISMIINAVQRGVGNTKIAMITNVTSNVINILGNYLLIQGNLGFPKLGIKGAAIATVGGTVVSCIMSIYSICELDGFVSVSYILKQRIKFKLKAIKDASKICGSVFTEQLLMRVGFMAVAVMAADMGTRAFAVHQVGMNMMSISFSFGDGLQAAAVTLTGQSLGCNEKKKAIQYGRICICMGIVISIALGIIYLTSGGLICRLFFKEADIVQTGIRIFYIMIPIVFLQIVQIVYTGCLRSAGDVLFTMITSLVSVTIIRTLISYLFCYIIGWGLIGVWMGVLADQLSRFLFASIRFHIGKWTDIHI